MANAKDRSRRRGRAPDPPRARGVNLRRGDLCSGEDDGSVPGTLHKHKKPGHCPSPGDNGSTPGIMTVNEFQKGEDGGGPAACGGKYLSDKDPICRVSTQWHAGGRRCHKLIGITSRHNGRPVVTRVVDEYVSRHGCKDNIGGTSEAVWQALGLDSNIGEVPVT